MDHRTKGTTPGLSASVTIRVHILMFALGMSRQLVRASESIRSRSMAVQHRLRVWGASMLMSSFSSTSLDQMTSLQGALCQPRSRSFAPPRVWVHQPVHALRRGGRTPEGEDPHLEHRRNGAAREKLSLASGPGRDGGGPSPQTSQRKPGQGVHSYPRRRSLRIHESDHPGEGLSFTPRFGLRGPGAWPGSFESTKGHPQNDGECLRHRSPRLLASP